MNLKEKVLLEKVVNKHKKLYKGIAILLLIPMLPIQLTMFLFSKIGAIGDFVGGTIASGLSNLRNNIFKMIFYKELPTYQEKYGMTKEEFFKD